MRISRSLAYQFQTQDYEYIKPMASVTVDSIDLGITPEALAGLNDVEMERHVKELGDFASEVLEEQLKPYLLEAEKLCFQKSAAHDVFDYHGGAS